MGLNSKSLAHFQVHSLFLVILLIIRLGNGFSHLRISLNILHFVVIHDTQITGLRKASAMARGTSASASITPRPHFLCKRFHFMLGSDSHRTAFLRFRLGDFQISLSLIGL